MPFDNWGLNLDYDSIDQLLKKDDLVEEPVPIEVFVRDKKYLGLEFDLSEVQLEISKHITQIFKAPTLIQLYGEGEGLRRYKDYTENEVICMIGKGGGKDHTSRISMAYIIYLLHCLRDPLEYYRKSYGVTIDLINLAVNAQQAKNVFFEPFKKILLNSPYFTEIGFEPRVQELIFFSRPIRAFSGHSESEGWEGYEILVAILDEIAAFKTDVELKGERSKSSASAVYNMSKLSVMSRFPEVGKVVLLSFPRYKGDFITDRYESYSKNNEPKTWGIKATTWEANPTITREDLDSEFIRNPIVAESRFACNPPEMEDAYFRNPELVRQAFMYHDDPETEVGTWKPWFNGTDGAERFIHVDLGLKRDKCALCMVHMAGWKNITTMTGTENLPVIDVDYITYWRAPENDEIPFDEVRRRIVELSKRFSIASVTFDQWQSIEMIQTLKAWGFNADMHNVKKTDYDTLSTTIYDERLRGYPCDDLVEKELLKLKLINNMKVDHPATGEKDMSDSLAGATFMCISNIEIVADLEIEIFGNDDVFDEAEETVAQIQIEETKIPQELEEWLLEII